MDLESQYTGDALLVYQAMMSLSPSRDESSYANILIAVLLVNLLVFVLIGLRLWYILRRPRHPGRSAGTPTHLLVVLGSGGHTAEMLSMLRHIDIKKYTHRTYLVSSGDDFSASLAKAFEEAIGAASETDEKRARVVSVPRARRIHQSLFTAPWSSLSCFVTVCRVLTLKWPEPPSSSADEKPASASKPTAIPDVIITNGPATGVIVVLASFYMRFVGQGGDRQKMRTVYVESWARVKWLSLSGRILLRLVDRFVIQWQSLREATGGRGELLGALM